MATEYDQEYSLEQALKEFADIDATTAINEILSCLCYPSKIEISKDNSSCCDHLTAKKHRNKKWRKARVK